MPPRHQVLLRFIAAVLVAAVIGLIDVTPALATSTSKLLTLTGEMAADRFGTSASTAGDFNHDGYRDWIIGAPGNDAGGTDAGRAYLYYGGATASTNPALVLGPGGFNAGFGASVAGGADLNGDGIDDVIVGAPGDGGTGKAYVFLGGFVPASTPALTLTGEAPRDSFGLSVAAADINGDGYSDIVVGAPFNVGFGPDSSGRVYVYLGGPTLHSIPDLVLTGQSGEKFGYVASAGDFDGDGLEDLIIGAPGNDDAGTDAGRALIFPMNLTLHGASAGDNFGASVASAKDVNGDGYPDVIVGAAYNDSGSPDAGRAYVYYGGPSADAIADLTLTGAGANGNFGATVAGVGDINQDGYADVAVAAPSYWDAAGRVSVYFGGAPPDSQPDAVFNGALPADRLGQSLAPIGDIDRDGFPDLIAGAPSTGSTGSASVYSIFPFKLTSPKRGDIWAATSKVLVRWQGHDLADVELSTDGGLTFSVLGRGLGGQAENSYPTICPELITGAGLIRITKSGQTANRSNSTVGPTFRIVKYPPAMPIAVKDDGAFSTNDPAEEVGASMTSDDFTGDGVSEVLIGAPGDALGPNPGNVYVGPSGPEGSPCSQPNPPLWCWHVIPGVQAGDRFGASVASIGDFNGDGYNDWIVGAPGTDILSDADVGRAYLFFGGSVLDTVPDVFFAGEAAGDQFGFAVAGAGDFNLDGYADVAISAPFNGAVGPNSGRVYIYYGSYSPNIAPAPAITIDARAPGEEFGYSLAGRIVLGDLLCPPPICDPPPYLVLVGAPYNDLAGAHAGAAYGFLGKLPVPQPIPADTAADLRLYGSEAGAHFGWSVMGVGDINGDRVDDVAIGAPDDDTRGIDAGRVTVVTLNPAAQPGPDQPCGGFPDPCCPACLSRFDIWGELAGDRFGSSLGSMDFNLDGLTDMLIGAPGYDVGGDSGPLSNAGRIYGFSGSVALGNPNPQPNLGLAPPPPALLVNGTSPQGELGSAVGVVAPSDLSGIRARLGSAHRERPATPDIEVLPAAGAPTIMPRRTILAAMRDSLVRFYDINRFHLLDDMAGVEWQVGSLQKISWFGNTGAQIDLSIDGGQSWNPLAQVAGTPGIVGSGPAGNRKALSIRVPHTPTRFARLRIWPLPWPWPCLSCPPIPGVDVTDTLFTIRTDVALLAFTAQFGPQGATLAWSTDVPVSPDGIAGYRLYRLAPGTSGSGQRIGPNLIVETHFTDPDAVPGASYRLVGINGLAEETELGKVALEPAIRGIRISPSPARSPEGVSIAFAAPQGSSGAVNDLDVGVYDVSGRRVADLAHGNARPEAGAIRLRWNLAGRGGRVGPGLYFVRVTAPSSGLRLERKLVVLP